jgi:hypothetical protein
VNPSAGSQRRLFVSSVSFATCVGMVFAATIAPAAWGLTPSGAKNSRPHVHRVVARGIAVSLPDTWRVVPPLLPRRIDRAAVISVGTDGVRPGKPRCAFGFFLIPPSGTAVVVIATPQFPVPRRSLAHAVQHTTLRKGSVECWYEHRGGTAFGNVDGRAYEVAILVGDAATRAQIDLSERVAASVSPAFSRALGGRSITTPKFARGPADQGATGSGWS